MWALTRQQNVSCLVGSGPLKIEDLEGVSQGHALDPDVRSGYCGGGGLPAFIAPELVVAPHSQDTPC